LRQALAEVLDLLRRQHAGYVQHHGGVLSRTVDQGILSAKPGITRTIIIRTLIKIFTTARIWSFFHHLLTVIRRFVAK
jgi:hypothetical protein